MQVKVENEGPLVSSELGHFYADILLPEPLSLLVGVSVYDIHPFSVIQVIAILKVLFSKGNWTLKNVEKLGLTKLLLDQLLNKACLPGICTNEEGEAR